MLKDTNLPLNMWAEAVNTVVYVLNRRCSKSDNLSTRFENCSGKQLCLDRIKKNLAQWHTLMQQNNSQPNLREQIEETEVRITDCMVQAMEKLRSHEMLFSTKMMTCEFVAEQILLHLKLK